jgi:hypothetical protein
MIINIVGLSIGKNKIVIVLHDAGVWDKLLPHSCKIAGIIDFLH